MSKNVKTISKSSASKTAIVKGTTNNNKNKTDNNNKKENGNGNPSPSIHKETNLVWMFSKNSWLPMDQLTAEQVGAEYKPQVTTRMPDGEDARPFMKATHEAIGELVMSIPGNGTDVTVQRMEAIYNMPASSDVSDDDKQVFDTPLASKFAANPEAKDAFDLGKQFDDLTIAHMVNIINGRKVYEGGFAVLAWDWERQFCEFNQDGVVVVDPCWKWPRAGSGTKRNPGRGNEPTDYYKIETDNGPIRGSVIDDMVMGSKLGEPFTMWKEIKKRASSDNWLVSPADAARVRSIITDPELKEYVNAAINKDSADQRAWETLDKAQNRDRNTMVSRWRQAIGFLQQRKAINDLPCVSVELRGEKDGASALVTTPIQLVYLKPGDKIPSASKALTINQFLKIDVPAAKLTAETEEKTSNKKVPVSSGHLLATLRKEAKQKTTNDDAPVPSVIRTFEELRDGVDSISLFLQTKGTIEQILAALNKNNEESKLLASSLCPIYDQLDKIEPHMRVLYELFLVEQATKNQEENTEKLEQLSPLGDNNNKQKAKGK